MDLDAAADELYGVDPNEFVDRRTALVAQARQVKDRPLAKQIGQLRRPTRSAWLVNLLARQAPDDLATLLELGDQLADAQRRKAGDELRRLSRERRSAVDRLAQQAIRLGAEAGYAAPDAALQEVAQSLQAALGDPEIAATVRHGRLTQATTYGGFGGGDLMAALAASMPGAEPAAGEPPAPAPAPAPAEDTAEPVSEPDPAEAAAAAERERRAAERQERETALAEAERAADQATDEADQLADQVEDLRRRLADAETAEAHAREAARAARKRVAQARTALAEMVDGD